MNKIAAVLLLAGFAAMAAFGVWAFHAGEAFGNGWGELRPIMPFVIGGLIVVGALTGVLMWLAFYSSRRGYDDPFDLDEPVDPPSK
jgi:cation transporter-like permease